METPFRLRRIRSKYLISLIYSYFDYHKLQARLWMQCKKSRTMLIRNLKYFKSDFVNAEEVQVDLKFNLLNGFSNFIKLHRSKQFEQIEKVYHADVNHKDQKFTDYKIINYNLNFEEYLNENLQTDLFAFLEDLIKLMGIRINAISFQKQQMENSSIFLEMLYAYLNTETDVIFVDNQSLKYIFKKRWYLNNPQNQSIMAKLDLRQGTWLQDRENHTTLLTISQKYKLEKFEIVLEHNPSTSYYGTKNIDFYIAYLNTANIKNLYVSPIVIDAASRFQFIQQMFDQVQFDSAQTILVLQKLEPKDMILYMDYFFSKLKDVKLVGLLSVDYENILQLPQGFSSSKVIIEDLTIEDPFDASTIEVLNRIIFRYGMKGINIKIDKYQEQKGSSQVVHKKLERLTCQVRNGVNLNVVFSLLSQSTNLRKLKLQLTGFDIRDYLKQLLAIVESIASHELTELTIQLESPKLNHCNDIQLLPFFQALAKFPFLKCLNVLIVFSDQEVENSDLIVNALCRLTRLEKLRLEIFYAGDMKERENFQTKLIQHGLKKYPNIKEMIFDEPYQRNQFLELLPFLRQRQVPVTIDFVQGKISKYENDEIKKWCPHHKLKALIK